MSRAVLRSLNGVTSQPFPGRWLLQTRYFLKGMGIHHSQRCPGLTITGMILLECGTLFDTYPVVCLARYVFSIRKVSLQKIARPLNIFSSVGVRRKCFKWVLLLNIRSFSAGYTFTCTPRLSLEKSYSKITERF